MGFYDVVERISEDEEISMSALSRAIGRPSSYIAAGRSRGSVPSVDNAALIVEAAGWRLVAVPVDAVPDDALVIEPPARDLEAEQRRALERRREQLRRELAETDKLLG